MVSDYRIPAHGFNCCTLMRSHPEQPGPHYRVTYTQTGDNDLKRTFEVAPPNAPEQFKTYIEASANRKRR